MSRKIAFFLPLLWLFRATCENKLCETSLSVDITDGFRGDHGIIEHGNVSYPPGSYFRQGDNVRGCVCNLRRCMRKCCPIGQSIVNQTCQPYDAPPFRVPIYDIATILNLDVNHFYVLYDYRCKNLGFYRLFPSEYPEDNFFLQSDGRLRLDTSFFGPDAYCLDYFVDEGPDGEFSALICITEEDVSQPNRALSIGMIISIPFLLATFLVYAILPDRNLHGKALMSYVITLMLAYSLLVFIQLYPGNFTDIACKLTGLFCYFFFMVSFFWMNVMCVDIWWAFSGVRASSGSRRDADRKRFFVYCAYAWGIPILATILILSLTMNVSNDNTAWYNPGLGIAQCWFRAGYPTLLYFYGPMGCLIVLNVTLFVITACKIRQVQKDTAVLRRDDSRRHAYEHDNQRFKLYLKLLMAMGINWSMEIISWGVNWQVGKLPNEVWYLTDFCNALYGLVIFLIFVCKANIWRQLQKRYYLCIGRPHLAQTVTQSAASARTNSSALSHTIVPEKTFGNEESSLTTKVP